jgi:hypothetical protein
LPEDAIPIRDLEDIPDYRVKLALVTARAVLAALK